jgi:adenylate cyclase class IV
MKKNNKTKTIPMSVFKEAALSYFKCQAEDIQIRMIAENKEAFMVYNEQGYKISTREKLLEDVELQLSDKDAAHQTSGAGLKPEAAIIIM